MKKTFKRQSKTLNSKSKKRTMKVMKGGAKGKQGKPVGDSGKPGKPSYNSRYGKSFGVSGLNTKFNKKQKLEQDILNSKKIQSDIAFANKELVALKGQVNSYLPREQQQPIFNGIQQKLHFIALKEAEASKRKPLAYLEAKLAKLKIKQKPINNDARKRIVMAAFMGQK